MRGKHALVAMAGGVVIALTVAGGGWASEPSSRKATELKIGFSAALSGP